MSMGNSRSAGDVSVRFSVQDAEVVRTALEALGKDGQAALNRIDAAGQQPSRAMLALSSAMSGVRGEMIALSYGAGPVGVFLSSLGPWGVAGAAGLGLAQRGVSLLNDEATKVGQRSIEMRNFAESTGLTVTQVAALERAAAGLGIEENKVERALGSFGAKMGELREGGGGLADALRAIKPELLFQVQASKNNADALNLIAIAYGQAGLAAQKFARDAFSKGGVQLGPLLNLVRGAGSLDDLAQQTQVSTAIPDELRKSWAFQKTQIDATNKSAEDLWSTLFTTTFLERQQRSADLWKQTNESIGEMTQNSGSLTKSLAAAVGYVINSLPLEIAEGLSHTGSAAKAARAAVVGSGPESFVSGGDQAWQNLLEGANKLAGQFDKLGVDFGKLDGLIATTLAGKSGGAATNQAAPSWVSKENIGSMTQRAGQMTSSESGALMQANDLATSNVALSQSVQAKNMQVWMAALGPAATSSEHLKLKLQDLAAEYEKGRFAVQGETQAQTDSRYERAKGAAILESAMQVTGAYIGALGPLATVQDQVKQKTLQLADANMKLKGAGLSKEQIEAVKNLTAAQAEWGHVTEAASMGTFNLGAAQKAAADELQAYNDKLKAWGLGALDAAAAQTVLQEKIKQTAQTAALAATPFKSLKQFELEAGDLSKQLDTVAAGSMNNLVSSLADIGTGAKSAGDGFKAFGTAVVRSIEEMVIKMTIAAPIARGLESVLGGFFGGVGGGGGSGGGGSRFTQGNNIAEALGDAFDRRGVVRFARGGIFDRPTMFAMGGGVGVLGEAGPEAIMPLARGPDGHLGVRGGGGGSTTIHQHFYLDGAMTKSDVVSMVKQGAAAAMGHTDSSIKQYDRQLPARMSDIQRDNF